MMPVVRDDAGVLTEVGEGHRPSASRGSTVRALAAKTGIDASGFRDGLIR